MLVEKSKMEQRYDAVLGVIKDGFSVTEVARKFNVSRQSVHAWMARYERGGLEALDDRSHRPRASPHQMDPAIEARVVELRRLHPHWGQITIAHRLAKEQVSPLPSPSAIYRALVRSGAIVPHAPRKKLVTYKRWERGRPMELWQMDVVGGVLTDDGTEAKASRALTTTAGSSCAAGSWPAQRCVRCASTSPRPWSAMASQKRS